MNFDGAGAHLISVSPFYPQGEKLRLGGFQSRARSVSRRPSGGARGLRASISFPLKPQTSAEALPGGKQNETGAGRREEWSAREKGPPPPRQLPALQTARGPGPGGGARPRP